MENEKINQERISPYTKKQFASKETLINILLFFVFFAISAFYNNYKKGLESLESRYIVSLIFQTLGSMVIYALIGFVFAYGIYRKKDKQEKNKYGLIFSIIITLLFLLVDLTTKSEEVVKAPQNRAVTEQKSDKYYSSDGKYSISFPGIPKSENIEIDTAKGKIVMHQSIFSNSKMDCAINYFDDPEEIISEEKINNQLISSRDGSIKNVNGVLVESKFFNFVSPSKSKSHGIDFTVKIDNSNLCFSRIIRIKNRIYHLMVLPKNIEASKTNIENFINSFYSDY